ncbi:hypothetical protein VaNZ11_005428 [Volvox africanus]|uniref:Uncharacterized protein n=1 Tax=Volvox africanus TaxID=51714 RepID=A0ABQ5S083_9CHLO|nr:hypothetical protein VaNZ11_005428 [Volvox africanus]
MLSRRSESCPRLARKEFTPQAQQPQQPLVPSTSGTARGCTLQDLGPEDRQKVAKLLKQVVDLGQEVLQLKQQRDELTQQAHASVQREQELQDGNHQLQKEHLLLKKKLAQVLLVLRASQAKVAAFEATQQGAQIAQCAVEVQTEPVSIVDPDMRSSISSNATACAIRSAATQLAQTAGNADLTGFKDSAAIRASLAMPAGRPPFLHVAPGAHVNITINHAPEPVTTAGAPTAPVGGGPVAQTNNPMDAEEAESITATSPEAGCNEGVASSLVPHCGASEYSVALVASPAAPAVIAIPTTTTTMTTMTTTAAVLGPVGASGTASLPRKELAPPEVSMGSCSAVGAGTLHIWPLQQTPVGMEAHDCVLGPAAMPKPPRHASAASSGQSICGKPPCPRNILVDATQRFEAVPVHEVLGDSREALTASPMIVPPCDEVVAAASRLLDWQAQHGLTVADEVLCAATAPSTISRDSRSGRKVLSYDPAIGQSGAFYFVDVPDMAADPAGSLGVLVSGATQAGRLGGGSITSNQPVPRPPHDAAPNAMPAAEKQHMAGAGPQLTPQALVFEGEATLRPWSDGHDASTSSRLGCPVGSVRQRHPNPHLPQHQHQQTVSERTTPASPCSSYTTETTCTPLVTMPPQLSGGNDTPASSSMSLSRMALALDEMARRQRWDVQPPGGLGQPHDAAVLGWTAHLPARGGNATQLAAPGAVVRHGGLGYGDFSAVGATGIGEGNGKRNYPHSASGQPVQSLRHGSTGSITVAGASTPAAAAATAISPLHGVRDAAPQVDALSTCGSTSNWLGGNDVSKRYDDSLVDILSQADEELEYQQQQNQQEHNQRQQQRARPQAQRKPLQASAAAAPLAAAMSLRSRAIPAVVPISLSEMAPTRAKQAASAEALLAANLYEENDVLSVILEQEMRV